MPTHSGSASHHSTPHFPLLNHRAPPLLIINFLLSFSTKSGHRGSRSPWRWQGRGICTSRSRRRIWKRMLRMYLAAIKDVLRMLLLPSTEVVGSDQEAKSSSTSRGWTWIAKTRCISSCLECWMLNVDVEVAYMSIVALPAPMAAVSRYLCGVKACTKIDLKEIIFGDIERPPLWAPWQAGWSFSCPGEILPALLGIPNPDQDLRMVGRISMLWHLRNGKSKQICFVSTIKVVLL